MWEGPGSRVRRSAQPVKNKKELLEGWGKRHNAPPLRLVENQGAEPGLMEESLMKRILYGLAMVVVSAAMSNCLMAQTSPFVGTWKLNVAKSKYEGAPTPKSMTRTVTAEGGGLKYSLEGEAADGSKTSFSFTSKLDGSDAAVIGSGMPGGADTIALTKVSAHKVTGISKKGGKEIGKVTSEVSKDGKTTTVVTRAKTADGKEVKATSVYEKQ